MGFGKMGLTFVQSAAGHYLTFVWVEQAYITSNFYYQLLLTCLPADFIPQLLGAEGILIPQLHKFSIVIINMRQLLSILIFITFAPATKSQTTNTFAITSKADKIFKDRIGDNFNTIKAKPYEVRTTNKKGVYAYYSLLNKKVKNIPNATEYLVTYKIEYPDLNFKTEVEILMNSKFSLKDSSAFENLPDYIMKNTLRDIITKDSAIKIAKTNGLASGDTLSIYLFREYNTGDFFWTIESEWKSYFAKLEKEYKHKGGPRRRRGRPKDELFVHAKNGEVLTYNQMPH